MSERDETCPATYEMTLRELFTVNALARQRAPSSPIAFSQSLPNKRKHTECEFEEKNTDTHTHTQHIHPNLSFSVSLSLYLSRVQEVMDSSARLQHKGERTRTLGPDALLLKAGREKERQRTREGANGNYDDDER